MTHTHARVNSEADMTDARRQNCKLLAIVAVTLAIMSLLWGHFLLNGSRFHLWAWHRAPIWPYVALMVCAAIPFAIAQSLESNPRLRAAAIGLLMLSLLAMQIVSTMAQDHEVSLVPIARMARSWLITSYLSDAQGLIDSGVTPLELLRDYPRYMETFRLHSREKPPGLVLYWWIWLRMLGPGGASAIVGGLVLGALATLALPATYWFMRTLTHDRDAGFAGTSYLTLTPSLIVFLPQFDQLYPVLACVMLGAWVLAMRTGRLRWAVVFGATLALACFLAYNLLVLGTFVVGYAVMCYWSDRTTVLRRFTLNSLVAIAVFSGFYGALWLTTGFDPIATFATAVRLQHAMAADWDRPWGVTIPSDFVDFAMGIGWIGALLIVFYFASNRAHLAIGILCVAQPIIVALTGLLRSETSRVWMFMLPLLMVPVGLELARWHPAHRWMVYFCLWVLVAMTGQNLRFH